MNKKKQPPLGLLLYIEEDYRRNRSYVEWFLREASETGLELHLAVLPDPSPAAATAVHEDAPADRIARYDEAPSVEEAWRLRLESERRAGRTVSFLINRTRLASVAARFEQSGCRVFNSSRVARIGNDKIAGYRWAQSIGLLHAPLVPEPQDQDYPLVQKPVFGHGGRDVLLLNRPEDLRALHEPYLLQRVVPEVVGDLRFYVIGGRMVYGVLRRSVGKFTCNFSLGAAAEIFECNPEQLRTLNRALDHLAIDYAGVDFLLTASGQLYFNEVEDVVGSRMLSHLGINDTTGRFLRHVAKTLGEC